MKVTLRGNKDSRLNIGPRKIKFTGRLKTRLRGSPNEVVGDCFRALQDDFIRLLEDGDFRLLEDCGGGGGNDGFDLTLDSTFD